VATQLSNVENLPAVTPEAERFALLQRQAKVFSLSPLVPETLRKGTPEQAMANCYIALALAEAMDEMPLIVMQNIHVINGKAGIARANASGKFKDDIDWEVSGSGETLKAVCFATLTKSGKRVEMEASMKMAKAEGWTKNSKYQTMPEVMLRYRSASFLVNMYAPEVMLGYKTVEEIEDITLAAAPSAPALTGAMLIEQTNETRPSDADAPGVPGGSPETVGRGTEAVDLGDAGPNDWQRGETVTLESAKAEIDACELVMDVNSRCLALVEHLDEDASADLRAYAAERAEMLKGGN
jgi:hypothetical protein